MRSCWVPWHLNFNNYWADLETQLFIVCEPVIFLHCLSQLLLPQHNEFFFMLDQIWLHQASRHFFTLNHISCAGIHTSTNTFSGVFIILMQENIGLKFFWTDKWMQSMIQHSISYFPNAPTAFLCTEHFFVFVVGSTFPSSDFWQHVVFYRADVFSMNLLVEEVGSPTLVQCDSITPLSPMFTNSHRCDSRVPPTVTRSSV